jgi:hypothetical protein
LSTIDWVQRFRFHLAPPCDDAWIVRRSHSLAGGLLLFLAKQLEARTEAARRRHSTSLTLADLGALRYWLPDCAF